MQKVQRCIQRRDRLVGQLSVLGDAIGGNLSKAAVPPGSSNFYWRITWKESQKTKIQYVRPDELAAFENGIKQFSKLKALINQIGDINRSILLLRRTEKTSGSRYRSV
jgi:hypothetical protein